jgi:hypothetical protein
MKFTISKSSDFWHDEDYEKEINSLDELKQFQIESGHSIIINFERNSIEIYDTLRE